MLVGEKFGLVFAVLFKLDPPPEWRGSELLPQDYGKEFAKLANFSYVLISKKLVPKLVCVLTTRITNSKLVLISKFWSHS